ncbi:hypothetical protein WG66_014193 [Moniliophthora roreri]|nr:hypothetical protein WG66_014193 [Moniliophthora roreri]
MFPVSDFNFVVCGMATFAATVGYVCGKRLRGPGADDADMSTNALYRMADGAILERAVRGEIASDATESELATGEPKFNLNPVPILPTSANVVSRRPSLKRKRMHDHDENNIPLEYPYNLAAIYPNKRSKTPPKDDDLETKTTPAATSVAQDREQTAEVIEDVAKTDVVMVPENDSRLQSSQPGDVETTAPAAAASPEPSPPEKAVPSGDGTTENEQEKTDVVTTKDDKPVDKKEIPKALSGLPTPPASPAFLAATPPAKPSPTPAASPFGGFASFASSPSTFSLGGSSSTGTNSRPAWAASTSFGRRRAFLDDGGESSGDEFIGPNSRRSAPLEAKAQVDKAQPNYTRVTGEEEEDVVSDLKGVKLFVKRGPREFTGGMLGHVKLLSSRNKNTVRERLLFRREPLWQVTMNALLRPSVRCTFDEEECILRVILAEAMNQEPLGDDLPAVINPELVVYAIKPGRSCPKQDFVEFANAVLGCASLEKKS